MSDKGRQVKTGTACVKMTALSIKRSVHKTPGLSRSSTDVVKCEAPIDRLMLDVSIETTSISGTCHTAASTEYTAISSESQPSPICIQEGHISIMDPQNNIRTQTNSLEYPHRPQSQRSCVVLRRPEWFH